MKSLIAIIVLAGASWHYIDLGSESALHSVVAPIVLVLALIWFALWLVVVALAWLYHRPLLAAVLLLTAGVVATLSVIAIAKIVKANKEAPAAA